MSAEIQESLNNFKVIVAFNRTDYFREKFNEANERNFSSCVAAGLASNMFMPIYGLAQNLAQILVLAYGIYLIAAGSVTVGLLIGFLLYVNSFYMPLRQLAAMWASIATCAGRRRSNFGSSRAGAQYAGVAGRAPTGSDAPAIRECDFGYPRRHRSILRNSTFYAGKRQDLCAGWADRRR